MFSKQQQGRYTEEGQSGEEREIVLKIITMRLN